MPIPAKYQYIVNQFAKIFSTLDGAKGKTVEHVIDHLIPDETSENRLRQEILRVQSNTLSTTTPATIDSWITAVTNDDLDLPVPEYDTSRLTPVSGQFKLNYNASAVRDVKVIIAGTITSDSTNNANRIGVRLSSGSEGVYTGSTKIYPAGTSLGGDTTVVGFTTIGFGRLQPTDSLELQVSKNFTGTLVVENCILSIEPLL